jgi:hypothetical protein
LSSFNSLLRQAYNFITVIAPYRFVKFSANEGEVVQASAAADLTIGVADEIGTVDAAGRIEVDEVGHAQLAIAATIAQGVELTSDAAGRGVAAAAGNHVGAITRQSGVSGDVVRVQVVNYFKP